MGGGAKKKLSYNACALFIFSLASRMEPSGSLTLRLGIRVLVPSPEGKAMKCCTVHMVCSSACSSQSIQCSVFASGIICVFVVGLVVLFMNGVVKVMPLDKLVDFVCELMYFSALLLEVGGPPSFLIRGWFGEGDVIVNDSVDGVFEIFEGGLEFTGRVKGVGDGEFVKFDFHVLDEVVPLYFSPVVSGRRGRS